MSDTHDKVGWTDATGAIGEAVVDENHPTLYDLRDGFMVRVWSETGDIEMSYNFGETWTDALTMLEKALIRELKW